MPIDHASYTNQRCKFRYVWVHTLVLNPPHSKPEAVLMTAYRVTQTGRIFAYT
jgi:hypothetical protein